MTTYANNRRHHGATFRARKLRKEVFKKVNLLARRRYQRADWILGRQTNIMKTMISACWALFIVITGAVGASGGQFSTDINPALRYYQAFIVAPDLSQAERDYLFLTECRGPKPPAPVRYIGRPSH